MAVIIDGQKLADDIRAEISKEIETLKAKYSKVPGIVVIQIGEDAASSVYVGMKEKVAKSLGMYSIVDKQPATITTKELLALINKYNNDNKISGILVQLPLPSHIDEKEVLFAIDPKKDVDGFHPFNVGLLNIGEDGFVPCTPYGVMQMLKAYNIDTAGKNAVIVGRSNIVGKPMAALLLKGNATITVCHSKTKDLKAVCKGADILVAAIGRPKMITADYVKQGAVVIDVGINRVDNKLCGDVDFESVKDIAGYITPVPKGVGPMTIAMLMKNTLTAFKQQNSKA